MDQREYEFRTEWLRRQLEAQSGVVTWDQLREGALDDNAIRRKVRRRELRRVHPRVYIDHTGPLTWTQRAWAAVLYAAPAALCGDSIIDSRRRESEPIHVAIDHRRRITAPEGVVIHRLVELDKHVFGASPPRLRLEDNALMMAGSASSELEAIGVLADTVGRRGVTAHAVRAALDRFPRLRRRAWIAELVDDLELGTASVLEHGYLTRVERAHGLPAARRQAPRLTPSGRQFRDLEYVGLGLVVELDGHLGHASWEAGGRDADRELDDLAASGAVTARMRWHQVFGTPCRTAALVARILQRHGWNGHLKRCATPTGECHGH